jgi:hypothetical protein
MEQVPQITLQAPLLQHCIEVAVTLDATAMP